MENGPYLELSCLLTESLGIVECIVAKALSEYVPLLVNVELETHFIIFILIIFISIYIFLNPSPAGLATFFCGG